MPRLITFGLAVLLTAAAPAPLPPSGDAVFRQSPSFRAVGPELAKGAVLWLHGAYSDTLPQTPPEQAWIKRLAAIGYDIWRLDRRPGHDPLPAGQLHVAEALRSLRASGYRRVVLAGYSRGAFIGLSVLAHPGLADAIAAVSPAAHGSDPTRRPLALAVWRAMMEAARGRTPLALVVLADDPLDPGPDERIAEARDAAARTGSPLLLIDRPPTPRGHTGSEAVAFDALFGACLAGFLDAGAIPPGCPPPARPSVATATRAPS